jgi:hypothetical protein
LGSYFRAVLVLAQKARLIFPALALEPDAAILEGLGVEVLQHDEGLVYGAGRVEEHRHLDEVVFLLHQRVRIIFYACVLYVSRFIVINLNIDIKSQS